MTAGRILIADDDQALARAIAIRCWEMGCETDMVRDGQGARGVLARELPDLLILDVDMPGEDGLKLAEELVADQRYAEMPVILLTGSATPHTIARSERLGLHYVWKGLETWRELEPLINRLLPAD